MGGHRRRRPRLGHAVALGPLDGSVIDDRDAYARDFQVGHALDQCFRGQRTACDDDGRQEPALDAGDADVDRGLVRLEGRLDGKSRRDGNDKNAKALEAGVIHGAPSCVLGQDSVCI